MKSLSWRRASLPSSIGPTGFTWTLSASQRPKSIASFAVRSSRSGCMGWLGPKLYPVTASSQTTYTSFSAMRTMLYGAAHLRRFRGPGIYHGAYVQEIRTSLRPAAHARTVGTGLRRRPRRRLAGAAGDRILRRRRRAVRNPSHAAGEHAPSGVGR